MENRKLMIRFIVAYDESAMDLGSYFNDCKTDIVGFLEEQQLIYGNVREISSNNCTIAAIGAAIQPYNPQPFVFIAYSHGVKYALRCNGDSYVSAGVNSILFANSLFFTNACLAGKDLGKDLIDNGCITFVGFEEEISAFKADKYKSISIACDNAGLKYFFAQNVTINEAVRAMKQYYTNQIDRLESFKDMAFAGYLAAAREALVVKGDLELIKEQLYYSQ